MEVYMKNKWQFAFGILIIILSLVFIFVGAITSILVFVISLIFFITGIALIMNWSTNSYRWVCSECGGNFKITLKENLFGVNCGVNNKKIYCPKYHKKTICKGIYAE